MTQPVCPFSKGYPAARQTSQYSWHKPILLAWLWMALMGSIAWMALSAAASSLGFVPSGWGRVISLLGPITLLIVFLKIYSLHVRNRFRPADARDGNGNGPSRHSIPTQGIFRTLLDVVVRKKTLLRDIDVERMKKYGDMYLMFAGPLPVIVVTSSSLVEKISREYEVFAKSDPRHMNMPYYFKWVGNSNVVLANGKQWHRIRQMTHPALNAVHVFSPVFNQKAHFLCQALREQLAHSQEEGGTVIPLTRWLKAVSLDSAGVALFGFDFNHLKEESNPGIDAMDYVMAEVFDPARIALSIKNRLPLESNRHLERCMKHLDQLVVDMIDSIDRESDVQENGNVLAMLIRARRSQALNNEELRNNIIAMVLASHETTQVALGGVLYFLARYPDMQEKLRKESIALFPNLDQVFSSVDNESTQTGTYQKLRAFHSMGNFILESLRMYSPLANQNSRTTSRDTELGGYFIPKGSLISMNIHAIHMNPKEWDRPEEFNPNRFTEESCPNKFAYLPFGAGPRVCAGRNFTLMEQKIILCHILRNFEVSLPNAGYKVPIRRGSFTGLPETSFQLRFRLLGEEAAPRTVAPGLTVYRRDEAIPESIKTSVISVSYPRYWFAPVALSPFSRTIEEETIEWMDSLGLVKNKKRRAHLLAMEPRHYAGYSHSMASYEHALMYCKYITMWLLWDDECVEVATDYSQVAAPVMALAGEDVPAALQSDPYVLAFRHIGDEYERLGASREWRIRFAVKMREWTQNAVEEEAVRRKGSVGTSSRSFSDAIKLRAITVGIRPNSLPLERAVGIEIPLEIDSDPDYQALVDQAARVCCIVNDLVGVPKDIRNKQQESNLILYHQMCSGGSLKDSYGAVLKIHDEAVKRYDELAWKVLEKTPSAFRERMKTFLRHLRYMDSGFGFWHRDCIRYQQLVVVEDNLAFRIQIEGRCAEGAALLPGQPKDAREEQLA